MTINRACATNNELPDHTRHAPGLSRSSYHKRRSEYDDDITFSINILMDRFRGLANVIEALADHHGELDQGVDKISDDLRFIADSARHFADEGDLLAKYAADELNAKDAA